jgi:hypothetical protein
MAKIPLSPIPQYGEPTLKAEEKQSKSEYTWIISLLWLERMRGKQSASN